MQTLLLPSDRKSDICNRMMPLRMLSVTLTYIFKITKFEMWISWKRWKLTKHAQVWLYTGWYMPSNGTIANVVFHGFDLIFHGQIFQMLSVDFRYFKSLKWLAKHASYGFYRFWYLPINGAIPKEVLCDVSQIFQRLDIPSVNISEATRAAQICQIQLL